MLVKLVIKVGVFRSLFFVGNAVYVFVISKFLTVDDAGIYFTCHAIFLFTTLLSRFGMDRGLIKYIATRKEAVEKLRIFKYMLVRSCFFNVSILLILLLAYPIIPDRFIFVTIDVWTLSFFVIASFFYNTSLLVAAFLKGDRKPVLACMFENGAIALFAGLLVVLFSITGELVAITNIAFFFLMSCTIFSLCGGTLICYQQRTNIFGVCRSTGSGDVRNTLNSYGRISVWAHLSKILPIVMIGYFYSSSDVALYKIAEQLAAIPGFVLVVISSVFSPRFSYEYSVNNLEKLSGLFKNSIFISSILGGVSCVFIYVISDHVLAYINEAYFQAAPFLVVLLISSFVNVAAGPVIAFLAMTGHERSVETLLIASGAAAIVMYLVAGFVDNVIWVAIVTLIVVSIQNVGGLMFLKYQFGK